MRRALFRLIVPLNRLLYEKTGGALGGSIRGAPILLLTTTGRKSGKRRTTPLLYVVEGGAFVVVASAGGAPRHPGWFLNLEANPQAEVQIGREHRSVTARTATGAERERLWRKVVALYPDYDTYQGRTGREIPVVVLVARLGLSGQGCFSPRPEE